VGLVVGCRFGEVRLGPEVVQDEEAIGQPECTACHVFRLLLQDHVRQDGFEGNNGRESAHVDVVLYALERAKHELVEQFRPAEVVSVTSSEEDDVCRDVAVFASVDGSHERHDDVEEHREVEEREDDHLVRLAAVPIEGLRGRYFGLFVFVVQPRRIPPGL
jgi:hypothetical protein